MKTLLTTLMLLLAVAGLGQTKKEKKDAPPTQKEMQDLLKEAKGMMAEMMQEMSEEDRKLMDSLGVGLPDMDKAAKGVSGVSDRQLADAWADEDRVVPPRDAQRIAAIPKSLKDTEIAAYVAKLLGKSKGSLTAEHQMAAEAIQGYLRTQRYDSDQSGAIAVGLWLYGKPEVAHYLLGSVCAADATNTDNLSNYAAMLTMQGGQHLAIPILDNLNGKFPWNTTLLNNLGQAWFGLGDLDRAGRYLDSAIALYPYHPQANLTKAAIEESKGQTEAAIASVKKSIKHAYTPKKEEKLNKLGYKLKYADLYLPFVRGGDPLELETIHRPEYPRSVLEANQLYPVWREFIAECKARIEKLERELPDATHSMFTTAQHTAQRMMKDFQQGYIPTVGFVPFMAKQAMFGANESTAYFERQLEASLIPNGIKKGFALDSIRGAHRLPPPEDPCIIQEQAKSALIRGLNDIKKFYEEEYLEAYRHYLKEMGHWALFTSTDQAMLRMIAIQYQISYLEKNIEFSPAFEGIDQVYTFLCDEKEPEKKTYGKLQEFDDTDACTYKSKVTLGGPVTMRTNCTHTTWEFRTDFLDYTRKLGANDEYEDSSVVIKPKVGGSANIGPLKAGASFGSEITVNMDTKGIKDWNAVVKAEAQLGVGGSLGPISSEAKVSAAMELELDENGVKSASYTTKAQVNVGLDTPQLPGKEVEDKIVNQGIGKVVDAVTEGKGTSFEIGVQNRTSLISGSSSRTGLGLLSGIRFE